MAMGEWRDYLLYILITAQSKNLGCDEYIFLDQENGQREIMSKVGAQIPTLENTRIINCYADPLSNRSILKHRAF